MIKSYPWNTDRQHQVALLKNDINLFMTPDGYYDLFII